MESHRRGNHPNYKPCINMFDCSYGTQCHYSHEPLKKAYRCYQCGDEFSTRSEMMFHSKHYHEVEDCREFLKNASCRYKERYWWNNPFGAKGVWDAPQKQTPPNKIRIQPKHSVSVKSVEKPQQMRTS